MVVFLLLRGKFIFYYIFFLSPPLSYHYEIKLTPIYFPLPSHLIIKRTMEKKSAPSSVPGDDIDPTNILRIWNRIVGVVIGFFASFIFDEIKELNNQLEVGILTIAVFITWMIIDGYVRKRLSRVWTLRKNKAWRLVILEIMDFAYSLGIFLVIQFLLSLLSDSVDEGDLSSGEKFVGVYTIIIIVFSFFQTLKMLHNPNLVKTIKTI